MIATTGEIFVATSPIDLRLSFDRLAAIVRDALGGDSTGDAIFVFHNRHRTHVKILARDATGSWIHYKRLDRGAFRIPTAIPPGATRVRVERRELALLLEGIDHAKLRAARRAVRSGR
jgi:transposase